MPEPISRPRLDALRRMAERPGIRSASVSPSVKAGLIAKRLASERRRGGEMFLYLTLRGVRALEANAP